MASWLDEATPVEPTKKSWMDEATPVDATTPSATATPKVPGMLQKALSAARAGFDLGIGPKAQAAIQAALPVEGDAGTYAGRYFKEFEAAKAQRKQEEQQGGRLYKGVKFATSLPAAIGSVAAGPVAGSGIYGALTAGAEAEPDDTAHDMVMGGTLGAGTGKAFQLAAPALVRVGTKAGRRAINAISGRLSAKKALSDEAVQAASATGAFKPIGTVKGISDRLDVTREGLGQAYSDAVAKLEAAGVQAPDLNVVARMLQERGEQMFQSQALPEVRAAYNQVADSLSEIAAKGAGKVVANPGVGQVESIKRAQASKAIYDKVQGHKPLEEARRDIASTLQHMNEQAIESQAALAPEAASQFQPIKNQLGNIIKASDAARVGSAREASRRAMSLPTAIAAVEAGVSMNPASFGVPVIAHLIDKSGAQSSAWAAFKGAKNIHRLRAPALTEIDALVELLRKKKED